MSSDLLKITILQLPTVLQPRTRDSTGQLSSSVNTRQLLQRRSTQS